MRNWITALALAGAICLAGMSESAAQGCGTGNPNCVVPTPPTLDSSNRAANTQWVNNFVNAGLPLPAGKIWIGSAGNVATPQTPSGDLTVSQAGVFTFGVINANVGTFGSATQCAAVTVNAKGLVTAASQTLCSPAVTSVTGLASGIATFLATPSSANLAAALTDETGTGAAVFGTSPTIATPTVTGSFTATGLVTYADLATAAIATGANYFAGAANTVVPASVIYQAETTTTFGTTTTFDFSTFINTAVTLTANITTQTLSNVKAGQAGQIRFIQDGTGSRTTVWNSIFKFAGGTTPTLTTTAAAVDALEYNCVSATYCVASLIANVK